MSKMEDVLKTTLSSIPAIRGMVVMDQVGNVSAAVGESEESVLSLASFAIGARDLLMRLAEEAGCGSLESTLVRATHGHIAVHSISDEQILFTLANADAPLGTLAHDINWCAAQLRDQLVSPSNTY